MKVGALRALVSEAGELRSEVERAGQEGPDGSVVVSGMLAEQLARELRRDAAAGAVRVAGHGSSHEGDVSVHVFAGEASGEDLAVVGTADRSSVPIVLVQLWPQDDWTRPFVLSPFVVECRPGAGFPVAEIAARIVDATGTDSLLPSRVPALRKVAERRAVRESVTRAALLGALGGRRGATRPRLTLEQARLLGHLHTSPVHAQGDRGAQTVAAVAALTSLGLVLRGAARRARRVAPTPFSDAAIAAGGTWAVAQAARIARARSADR